jgi:hypothetical protein
MSPLIPGGPGGKYLGRSGPLTAAELREVVADVRDQLKREPEVLDELGEAILQRDLATAAQITTHLRDLLRVVDALLAMTTVGDGKAAS